VRTRHSETHLVSSDDKDTKESLSQKSRLADSSEESDQRQRDAPTGDLNVRSGDDEADSAPASTVTSFSVSRHVSV
jgi:hypothetical protein